MKLPPLPTLRAFEAAARHESFAGAAAELGMSAAAISQHVRTLEQWLGEPLFERQARGVRLTAAGREFGATVSSSLRQVAASAEEIRGRKQRAVVRLASLPSVVAYFLTPRLPRFRALHPDIQVSISYSTTGISVSADMTILHGRRPTESAVALFSAATRPTCAPAYLENFGPIEDIAMLSTAELLHDETEAAWQDWFAATGTRSPQNTGPIFADFNLLLTALKAGQGVGLCPTELMRNEIASGRLSVLFDQVSDQDKYYWLVAPEAMRAPAKLLFDWLVQEAQDQLGGYLVARA